MFFIFDFIYKNIFYCFKFSRVFFNHLIYTFMYIISLSCFRYIVFIKTNYEFRNLTENNTKPDIGLIYHRLDKIGDLYRFSVGQFYEYLSINKFYNSREKIININLEFIKDALGKTIYISIIYSIILSSVLFFISLILNYFHILSNQIFLYLMIVILSKTFLTFISTFRIANDSISKYPVNMFVNLLQVCLPILFYYIIYPILNIQFNFTTYIISGLLINIISLVAYYITLCLTINSIILPIKVQINISLLLDMYYLTYTIFRNLVNHIFIDILLLLVGHELSNSSRLEILYLLNAGLRNISGTFETPIDWVNRIYVSRYKNTKDFIINSYIIYAIFLIFFGYVMTFLINNGIYNKLMVIKFKNSSYYHKAFLIGVMSLLNKLWEVIVIANKKDNYPIIALLSGLLLYTALVIISTKYFFISYIDAFFYGAMINCLTQYLLFVIRGHFLLKIGFNKIIFEFIRYLFLAFIFFKISTRIN